MLAVQWDPAAFGPCFPMFDATWMCWNIIAVKNFAAVFLLGRISMGHSHDGGPCSQYTIIPICISHVTLLPWSHVMTRNMPWRAPRWDLLGYSSSTRLPHWQWATMPCQCAAGKIEDGFDLRDKWIKIIRGNRVFYPKMQKSNVFVSPEHPPTTSKKRWISWCFLCVLYAYWGVLMGDWINKGGISFSTAQDRPQVGSGAVTVRFMLDDLSAVARA